MKEKIEKLIFKIGWLFGAICSGLYGGVSILYLLLLTKLDRIMDYDMLNDLVIINTSFMSICIAYFLYKYSQKILKDGGKEVE